MHTCITFNTNAVILETWMYEDHLSMSPNPFLTTPFNGHVELHYVAMPSLILSLALGNCVIPIFFAVVSQNGDEYHNQDEFLYVKLLSKGFPHPFLPCIQLHSSLTALQSKCTN